MGVLSAACYFKCLLISLCIAEPTDTLPYERSSLSDAKELRLPSDDRSSLLLADRDLSDAVRSGSTIKLGVVWGLFSSALLRGMERGASSRYWTSISFPNSEVRPRFFS